MIEVARLIEERNARRAESAAWLARVEAWHRSQPYWRQWFGFVPPLPESC